MEIKVRKLSSVERELEVKLTEKEIMPLKERLYFQWQKKAEIPGYRRGRAPVELVLKKYKNEIEQDLKENIAGYFYKKALAEVKLVPLTAPVLLEINLTSTAGATFKMKVEEKPKIKLSKYKGLKVQKQRISVEEREVEEALEKLKKDRTQWLDVERESRKGDFLILDLKIRDTNGVLLDQSENAVILLEERSIYPELLMNLVGLKKGSVKEFTIDVPEKFHNKKIAGKKCHFQIKVNSVKEKKEPFIDDNFAREIGEYQNLDSLKEALREELKNYKDRKAEVEVEEKLIQDLLSNAKFELPPQLLQLHTRKVAEDITLKLLYRGIPKEDIEKQMDLIWQEAREEAQRQLKLYFILEEIAEKESLEISDQELEEYIKRLAQIQKLTPEELRAKLEEKKELQNLRHRLRREKVIEFIKRHAEILTLEARPQ